MKAEVDLRALKPSEDFVCVEINFADGARGRITCLSTPPFYGRFTVFGDQGWVEVEEGGNVDKDLPSRFEHCSRTAAARRTVMSRSIPCG